MRLFMTLALSGLMPLLFVSNAHAQHSHDSVAAKEALALSPAAMAAATALEDFAADFRKTHGKDITQEFVGLNSILSGEDAAVEIFSLATPSTLKTDVYDCHLHLTETGTAEDAHCQLEKTLAPRAFTPAPRSFTLEDFEIALGEGVAYFAKTVGKPETVRELKAWQTRSGIDMIFTYGNPSQKSLLNCHYHGDHIDCHKKTRPGIGEP
jgi:hypothetical protein